MREKKLARKKYKELRNIIGNEILLGKGGNTTPGVEAEGGPAGLPVMHRGNREEPLTQGCRPAPI